MDYQQCLLEIKKQTTFTEADLLNHFIESNAPKYQWDEWALKAYESQDFYDYVMEYYFTINI